MAMEIKGIAFGRGVGVFMPQIILGLSIFEDMSKKLAPVHIYTFSCEGHQCARTNYTFKSSVARITGASFVLLGILFFAVNRQNL